MSILQLEIKPKPNNPSCFEEIVHEMDSDSSAYGGTVGPQVHVGSPGVSRF